MSAISAIFKPLTKLFEPSQPAPVQQQTTLQAPPDAIAPPPPKPLPQAPTLSSGQVLGASLAEQQRQRRRQGFDQTILGSALGVPSGSNVQRNALSGSSATGASY